MSRFWACERKRGYPTLERAKFWAEMSAISSGKTIRVYKCRYRNCGKYHLTSKRGGSNALYTSEGQNMAKQEIDLSGVLEVMDKEAVEMMERVARQVGDKGRVSQAVVAFSEPSGGVLETTLKAAQ
jgi:hypothetical protein